MYGALSCPAKSAVPDQQLNTLIEESIKLSSNDFIYIVQIERTAN